MYKLRQPAIFDLKLYQDRDFFMPIIFDNDIETKVYKAQIRKNATSAAVEAEFSIDKDNEENRIDLSLERSKITGIKVGNYLWDLIETDNADARIPVLVGKINVEATITHDNTDNP